MKMKRSVIIKIYDNLVQKSTQTNLSFSFIIYFFSVN